VRQLGVEGAVRQLGVEGAVRQLGVEGAVHWACTPLPPLSCHAIIGCCGM